MSRIRLTGLCASIGLAGFLAGVAVSDRPVVAEELAAPRVVHKELPANRSLDANLWMQISAEYRACCHQSFNLARRRLIEKLQPPLSGWAKPPAIVLDLDETVLDNAAFMTRLARNGLTFDDATWDDFEKNEFDKVRLVPGAKAFIDQAKKLGVAIVYISNRKQEEDFRFATLNALELLDVETAREDFHGIEKVSDKTARRVKVESKYTVLLYIGDNLRDFHEGDFRSTVDNTKSDKKSEDRKALRAAIEKRAYAVDRCADFFGREWIILPNPAYGEWMKVLGLGEKDKDLLMGQP
jgi:acid phosphatase